MPPPLPSLSTLPQSLSFDALPRSAAQLQRQPVLFTTTIGSTILASLFSSFWLCFGLIVLALGEGSAGCHSCGPRTILLRILAWVLMYQIPVQAVAIGNIMAFNFYGVVPDEYVHGILWGCAFSPSKMRAHGLSRSLNGCRSLMTPIVANCLYFLVYAGLIACYIGETHQHMGFILFYGLGHILTIPVGDACQRGVPPLDLEYIRKAGAPLAYAMVAFFVFTSAYALLKRHTGAWLGIVMPLMLSLYEIAGTCIVSRSFASGFLAKPHVRAALDARGADQAIHASLVVALLHAMAEGARLTLILTEVSGGGGSGWLVSLCFGPIWNTFSRSRWLDHFIAKITRNYFRMASFGALLQRVKFSMSYPCFFVLFSVMVARVSVGHAALPSSQNDIALVVLMLFLSEIFEDLLCLGVHYLNTVPKMVEFSPASFVVPGSHLDCPKIAWASGEDSAGEEEARRIAKEIDHFLLSEPTFEALPFWSHFSIVMCVQFHTLVFITIFGGGINYVLGFCDTSGYKGEGQGLLWWPAARPGVGPGACAEI